MEAQFTGSACADDVTPTGGGIAGISSGRERRMDKQAHQFDTTMTASLEESNGIAGLPMYPWRPEASALQRAPHGLSRQSLARARRYMDENLGNCFTLDDLARAACVSRAHFARLFRVSTGTSPMAYLLRLRVEHAKQQLLHGHHHVSDIAANLGFCDQSHFSRVFRRMTGFTPREYGRMHG